MVKKARTFVSSVWSDYRIEAILVALAIVGFPVAFYFTERNFLSPSDLIQIYTLIILVIVTVSYAVSTRRIQRTALEGVEATRKQAEESRRAVEVALRSERNAVMPIVKLDGHGPYSGSSATASVENVGKGPALGLRVSAIVSPDSNGDYVASDSVAIPVLEVGKSVEGPVPFSVEQGPVARSWRECRLVAHYRDIYGQYFSSTFTRTRSGAVRFEYERLGASGSGLNDEP